MNFFIKNITKKFQNVVAMDNITLRIRDGEFMALLGPSGGGKTTTLRCIAGFVQPDSGEIFIGNRGITDLPPEKRGIGIVFQNYALWPHMTIFDNLAFGLRIKRLPQSEIENKVEEMLDMVKLPGLEHRYPRQLSGGEQQRIALARALVIEPELLLLDEPLTNLDAKLREEMRDEIRDIQKRLKITTLYVTHDQDEALGLSDRLAVINNGRIVQVGHPKKVYETPSDSFVANFVGISSFIEAYIKKCNEHKCITETEDGLLFHIFHPDSDFKEGEKIILSVRPEYIEILDAEPRDRVNVFRGKVEKVAFLGNIQDCKISVGKWLLRVMIPSKMSVKPGDNLILRVIPKQIAMIKQAPPAEFFQP